MHSTFSVDGQDTIEALCWRALALGLTNGIRGGMAIRWIPMDTSTKSIACGLSLRRED